MKRLFDLVLALILFIPVGILCLVLAVVILAIDRHTPFYRQQRVGRGGCLFTCIKHTTLRPTKNEAETGDKERDKVRLTELGIWFRNRGLDELPQIWNILIGDMSFVGPRPLLKKNLEAIADLNPEMSTKITEWMGLRSRVRPGLSGWHQIHSLGPKIVDYDLRYLRDPSLAKQLQIFGASIWIMFIGKERYFGTR